MIIVALKGGMGNQMFQYAMGRAIALKNGVPLKLDTSWFTTNKIDTPRAYALDHFNIVEEFASEADIRSLSTNTRLGRYIAKIKGKLLPLKKRTYIVERKMGYDEEVARLKDNVYLDGFWGTEKYFYDIKDTIIQDFSLRYPSSSENIKMAESIRVVNAVAIHVRRGDYISNATTNAYHGVCSLEYYYNAVQRITETVKDPHFFVFSDDHEWVRNNFKIDFPMTFFEHNSVDQGHEDVNLMSMCKHNIVANSSFSWWGAWLNKNPDKMVYAPEKWFNNSLDTQDLLPASWIKIQ